MILNLCHFDNIRVDAVCYWFKATAVTSKASLFARLTLGTTVAVDTLRVVTFQPKATWSHACDSRQNMKFLTG